MFAFLATAIIFPMTSQDCQLFNGPSLGILTFQNRKLNFTFCTDFPATEYDHNPNLRTGSDSWTGLQIRVQAFSPVPSASDSALQTFIHTIFFQVPGYFLMYILQNILLVFEIKTQCYCPHVLIFTKKIKKRPKLKNIPFF